MMYNRILFVLISVPFAMGAAILNFDRSYLFMRKFRFEYQNPKNRSQRAADADAHWW